MNPYLPSDKENAEKHVGLLSCFYCKMVFNNHQALGAHLRVHQEEINAWKSWNYPVHSSTFIDGTSSALNPISMSQPDHSSGGAWSNPSTLFSGVTSNLDFSNFCSNESSWVNASNYSQNNVGYARSQYIMSPNLSYGSASARFHPSAPSSSTVFISSASPATTGFPMGPSSYFNSNGACQFNTDELRTFRDGMPFPPRSDLPNFHHHNLRGRKRCLGEILGNSDMMNSSKRAQISSSMHAETEKPQKKELLLFKDVEDSFAGLGISVDDKEGKADLDLSLHL
ncbi:hypothetical protein CMV_024291 [Castanea mollissima]|uniref:C2H2-type domain-containing protein n=1 Tax=Castanea mollissima TaxID=60419 RepID=A0A8J4QND3_9ROSI|nr:hypothetical protein CMV_024291 [Castanea mollissima]